MSLCRQNYANACESALNEQINAELTASYTYLSLATYFERDDVALPGFAKFFRDSYKEESEHAQKMIDYQNARGGRVIFNDIAKPPTEWKSALNALESVLQLEMSVNEKLLKLHKVAEENNDAQMCDFIEGNFLNEQVEAQKHLADLVANLRRVGGDGLGLYLFDKQLHEKTA
eukprot:comp11159_c0_seq1/m.5645 comp11159_c0_seq1/g.5645  ORF comp11159_c0_seq1/g.5645 comp11159_c0_seq1/m.5645 type:complete len:173 (-) comp11159_c0_seq1:456-974(-)